jgi:hypothetical protein
MVKLMFDTKLSKRKGDVLAPFSNKTPPPLEVRSLIASDHVYF